MPGLSRWSEGIILFISKPGSGKDVQGLALAVRLGIPFFSWSGVVTHIALEQTPRGEEARDYLARKALAPVSFVEPLLREGLSLPSCWRGCVLVGVPRTLDQALCVEEVACHVRIPIARAINLITTDASSRERILNRGEGRPEDNSIDAAKRIRQFREETAPVLSFFRDRGQLIAVNGEGSKDIVAQRIFDRLMLETFLGVGNAS